MRPRTLAEAEMRRGHLEGVTEELLQLSQSLGWFPPDRFVRVVSVDVVAGTSCVYWRSRHYAVDSGRDHDFDSPRIWAWCVAECRFEMDASDAARRFLPRLRFCNISSPRTPTARDTVHVADVVRVGKAAADERDGVESLGAAVRAVRAVMEAMQYANHTRLQNARPGAHAAVADTGLPVRQPGYSPHHHHPGNTEEDWVARDATPDEHLTLYAM